MLPSDLQDIVDRFPRLSNLLAHVPADVVRCEIVPKVEEYESLRPRMLKAIPTARLDQVFPAELECGGIMLEDFLGQWGNMTVEELCKICLIARWLKPEAVFEFGTYNGLTTRQIALNIPESSTLFTLDIDPKSPEAATLDIGEVDRILATKSGSFQVEVGHKFRHRPEATRIRQLWGDSTRFDFTPYSQRINLVFIDAGHTYDYVRSDTQNALQMLDRSRPGVILWHDYDQVLHPGVSRYLCELAESGMSIRGLRGTNLAVCLLPPL